MRSLIFWLIANWGWFRKWFGEGTPDDFRNPFWRVTEGPLAVKVSWAITLFDFRFLYRKEKWQNKHDKWVDLQKMWDEGWELQRYWKVFHLDGFYPTQENFWNGVFTFQIYLVAWRWFIWPRLSICIRPLRDWYFLFNTPGWLFDCGKLSKGKFVIFNWYKEGKIDAYGWEEGSV